MSFLEEDQVSSITDVVQKLKSSALPMNVHFSKQDDKLVLYLFDITSEGRAVAKFSLTIFSDLSFAMFAYEMKIKKSSIAHITSKPQFETCSEILNTVAFLKNKDVFTTVEYVSSAIAALEKSISSTEDNALQQRLEFTIEQLRLSMKTKSGRRFSSSLLAMSALWLQTSPALYRQISDENVLVIPAVETVKRLTSALAVDCGVSSGTVAYLSSRFSKLEERDKLVSIAMDEVYTQKRVELAAGKVYGQENGQITKTLFCTMISSVGRRKLP